METSPNPPEFIPPPPTPPPVIAAPPATRQRKSRGWMVVAIILSVLLVISLFGNLTQLVTSALSFKHGFHGESFGTARDVGPKLDECLLENNKSQNKIAVITVDGIITSHESDEAGNNRSEERRVGKEGRSR